MSFIDSLKKIAVVGAGTMGNGIAQVCAQAGYKVVVIDPVEKARRAAQTTIEASLGRLVKKEKLTEGEASAALRAIEFASDLGAAKGVELAIEAIPEIRELKREIHRSLDDLVHRDGILATNTSSISITELASATRRPASFIGMHFMNPVPVMQLVEVIRGHATSDATLGAIMELSRRLGKTPVEVEDYPGFVANRILAPMLNEAMYCVMEGVATPEAIDEVMKLGMSHPMGPLALADFIGLDVCLQILEVLHRGLGDDKYRPCPLLRRMVAAGTLGRKSGRGFHDYSNR